MGQLDKTSSLQPILPLTSRFHGEIKKSYVKLVKHMFRNPLFNELGGMFVDIGFHSNLVRQQPSVVVDLIWNSFDSSKHELIVSS